MRCSEVLWFGISRIGMSWLVIVDTLRITCLGHLCSRNGGDRNLLKVGGAILEQSLLEEEERDENDVRFDRLYFLSAVHDRVYRLIYDVTRRLHPKRTVTTKRERCDICARWYHIDIISRPKQKCEQRHVGRGDPGYDLRSSSNSPWQHKLKHDKESHLIRDISSIFNYHPRYMDHSDQRSIEKYAEVQKYACFFLGRVLWEYGGLFLNTLIGTRVFTVHDHMRLSFNESTVHITAFTVTTMYEQFWLT